LIDVKGWQHIEFLVISYKLHVYFWRLWHCSNKFWSHRFFIQARKSPNHSEAPSHIFSSKLIHTCDMNMIKWNLEKNSVRLLKKTWPVCWRQK